MMLGGSRTIALPDDKVQRAGWRKRKMIKKDRSENAAWGGSDAWTLESCMYSGSVSEQSMETCREGSLEPNDTLGPKRCEGPRGPGKLHIGEWLVQMAREGPWSVDSRPDTSSLGRDPLWGN